MSGFDITIVAGKDKASSHVNVEGKVMHTITEEERSTFRLSDSQLKDAVNKSFGKRPNDAYLCSPTPWGDLYKTYNWEQTNTVVTASAEILDITSKPVALKTETFENNSSHDANFQVSVTDTVSDTVSSSWNTGGSLLIGQKIKYMVGFLGTGAESESSISSTRSWGEGGSTSKIVTVGSSASVSVTLKPQQAVVATLTASRGVMKVRIRYNAHLTGTTAINYNPTYQGHHFWSLNLGSVMSAGDIPNSVQSTEDIEVGYYSNGKVELKDKETGGMMSTRFF